MAVTTPPLSDLARRIARQEVELASLRQQLKARLANLHRRREKLQTELRTLDAEIEAATTNGSADDGKAIPPTDAPKPAASLPAQAAEVLSLPEFLVQVVREANGKPLTVAQLQQEMVRRHYPTKSHHIPDMVGARISELVKRGRLRRDPESGGVLLADSVNGKRTTAPPNAPRSASAGRKSKPTASTKATGDGQPSLRATVFAVLKKAGRTLSVQELAEQVQHAGYKPSAKKRLKDQIWATMAKVPGVERDPKGGYRLKKQRG